MRSAKQRAAIAQWKIVQRGLIPPKPEPRAKSWWLDSAQDGFTERGRSECAAHPSKFDRCESFAERMQAALDRITSASDPDEREEAEAAMAQVIRSAGQRQPDRFDARMAQAGRESE